MSWAINRNNEKKKADYLRPLRKSWPISILLTIVFGSLFFAGADIKLSAVMIVIGLHQAAVFSIVYYDTRIKKIRNPLMLNSLLHSSFIGLLIIFSGGMTSPAVVLLLAWITYLALYSEVDELKKGALVASGSFVLASILHLIIYSTGTLVTFLVMSVSVAALATVSMLSIFLNQKIEFGTHKREKIEKQYKEKVENINRAKAVQEKLIAIKEFDVLLDAIGQEIKDYTKSSTVLLFEKNESNLFRCRKAVGKSAGSFKDYKTDAKKDIVFGEVATVKESIILPKKEIKIFLGGLSEKMSLKSALLLPLVEANEVIGVIFCLNKPRGFDDDDLESVGDIGSAVNLLFQNALRLEQIKSKSLGLENFNKWLKKNRKAFINILEDVNSANHQLEKALSQTMTMYKIAVELSKSLDEQNLLEAILINSAKLVQAKSGSLVLKSQSKLNQAANYNNAPELYLDINRNPVKWVEKHKKPIIINDFSKTSYRNFSEQTHIKSFMAVPLIQRGKAIGVLCLFNKEGGFSRKDSQPLETLAHQATVTILNARIHEREKRTIQKLKEVDKMKADFVASVSHELRSPLTTIKGYLDLVIEGEGGPVTETQSEFLSIVDQSSTRLLNLINDLLMVAKIESDNLRIKKELLSVNDILESVSKGMLPEAKKKKLKLVLRVVKNSPVIDGDFDRLEQVIVNFISNAIKFTEAGGSIELFDTIKENKVVIGVKDTGIGISAEDKKKLFDKFFRSDDAIIKNIKGTGLGLAIAKGIVEQHKGKVWVESTQGKGSTFYFSLPIKRQTAA